MNLKNMLNKILYPEGGNKMRAFVYILGASKSPNKIECPVPFEIDEKEIFFGPCKKGLRQKLKKEVDMNGKLDSETFFVGLNASNAIKERKKERKIVWAGKIQTHYTFQQANAKLVSSKYLPIKSGEKTDNFPLHVIPFKNGYQLKNDLHSENDDWILDLVSNNESVMHDKNSKSITLKKGSSFNRDICFIFSNIFFANRFGSGIEIKNEILDIFKISQPDKKNIDSFAVFGYRKDHSIDGKTGLWLELDNQLTQRLIKLIEKQAEKIKKYPTSSQTKTNNKRNKNYQGGCK